MKEKWRANVLSYICVYILAETLRTRTTRRRLIDLGERWELPLPSSFRTWLSPDLYRFIEIILFILPLPLWRVAWLVCFCFVSCNLYRVHSELLYVHQQDVRVAVTPISSTSLRHLLKLPKTPGTFFHHNHYYFSI